MPRSRSGHLSSPREKQCTPRHSGILEFQGKVIYMNVYICICKVITI